MLDARRLAKRIVSTGGGCRWLRLRRGRQRRPRLSYVGWGNDISDRWTAPTGGSHLPLPSHSTLHPHLWPKCPKRHHELLYRHGITTSTSVSKYLAAQQTGS